MHSLLHACVFRKLPKGQYIKKLVTQQEDTSQLINSHTFYRYSQYEVWYPANIDDFHLQLHLLQYKL